MKRLVSPDAVLADLKSGTPHQRCTHEAPKDYPARAALPQGRVSWSVEWPEYRPVDYTSGHVVEKDRTHDPKGWADPPDIALARRLRPFTSFEPALSDEQGLPRNPRGRTGMTGRGRLGNFGANYAGDALVTRVNPTTNKLDMIAVLRADSHQWAMPGGMVDSGEAAPQTQSRELKEETGVDIDFTRAVVVYRGYCDDRRNTDIAWMESTLSHVHIDDSVAIKPRVVDPKEVAEADWMPITSDSVASLYGSHPDFVLQAVRAWEKATGRTVAADGTVC